MHTIRYTDPVDFFQRVRPQLERDEAANGLMLGIAGRLCQDAAVYGDLPPYLAVVEESENDDELAAIAIMTPPYALLLQSPSTHVVQPFALLAADLAEGDWQVPGVNAPGQLAETFAGIWAKRAGLSTHIEMQLRTFELREVIHPRYSPGRLRCAMADELDIIADWSRAFAEEALGEGEPTDADKDRERFGKAIERGTLFVWDNGGPVSLASCGRPTAHGIAVNLVYTPPAERGKGYATSCVAALSQRLLDDGWHFTTLFTDLDAPAPNAIYQRIGYRPIGDYTHLSFE